MKIADLNNSQPREGKEQEIFIQAYDQYVEPIFRFIYFKVGSREEAQDLTSATFLKTWNYLQQNKINPETLKALLYKVARNSVIDYYRTKNYSQMLSLEGSSDIPDERQNIMKRMESISDTALVEESLSKLKDEYREIIILRYTEDFSISEIAEILDKSKTNTRVLIFRALRALREIMK